jgi:hypothetical protein
MKVMRLGFKISRGVNPLTPWNKTLSKQIPGKWRHAKVENYETKA